MKKIISIVLVLALTFALAACGNGDSSPSSAPPADSGSNASSPPAVVADGGTTTNTPAPIQPPSATETPSAAPPGGTIGFLTDDVDHWARPEYYIIYYNFSVTNLSAQMAEVLTDLGTVYNFRLEQTTANGDADFYITNLLTILIKDPDGLIMDVQAELAPRVSEILDEYNVPATAMLNRATDVDGRALIPCAVLNQYEVGRVQVEYLNNIYKDYWGDIDPSEIGLLMMDYSPNVEINRRTLGAEEKWNELFPGQPSFHGDTAPFGLSMEGGYNVANSIISANTDIRYWFVTGSTEDITLGATRAVEALDMVDTVLITSIGVAVLPLEWDSGYDGNWIAIYYVPPIYYCGTALFGLLALIDGRATKDTLWPEYISPGDQAAILTLSAEMMTRDNYATFLTDIMAAYGL